MSDETPVDRQAVHDEMEAARARFHAFLAAASHADLERPSYGTRWNNQQLLFHMLFGYLVVRVLLRLVTAFGHLPDRASRVFAAGLDAAAGPFHVVNYLGSCGGALVFGPERLGRALDRVVASLHRRLDSESEAALRRGMHFPPSWDPFFRDFMTLADVYHYATLHFDFHARQLSFGVAG